MNYMEGTWFTTLSSSVISVGEKGQRNARDRPRWGKTTAARQAATDVNSASHLYVFLQVQLQPMIIHVHSSNGGTLLHHSGAELTHVSMQECAACAGDTFENRGVCEACAYDATTCSAGRLALVGCGTGESSDVSVCTNCTAVGMFVSVGGDACVGGCPAGELVVPGAPGTMECAACAEDMFENGGVCEACTHDASNCNGDGFAFVGCGSGESSDMSTCTNCTALGMFASGNGTTCEGMCSAGCLLEGHLVIQRAVRAQQTCTSLERRV